MEYLVNKNIAHFSTNIKPEDLIDYLQGETVEYLKSLGVEHVVQGIRKFPLEEVAEKRSELVSDNLVSEFDKFFS